MKLVKVKNIDDCLEGRNVRDFLFDEHLDRDFVEYMGQLGKLLLYDELSKPFFKIIVRGKYTLKGSLPNKTLRVLLPDDSGDLYLDELVKHIEGYKYNA